MDRTLLYVLGAVALVIAYQRGALDGLLGPRPAAAPVPTPAQPPPGPSGMDTADAIARLTKAFADAFAKVVEPFVTND